MARYKGLMLSLLVLAGLVAGALTRAAPDPGVRQFLHDMYAFRARTLMTGQPAAGLDQFYDLTTQSGRFALAHESGRVGYVQAWAAARRLQVTEAQTEITNLRVNLEGDQATISLIARTRLGYQYEGQQIVNQMGVGSWHWLQLARTGTGWRVVREFYLDAMGDEWTQPYVPSSLMPSVPVTAPAVQAARAGPNRSGVTAYAETYCGAAWGCGNNADYNDRYRSYRNLGGDCANFASQALVEGGNMKPDWTWRYDKAGTTCWVNAQSFIQYLSGSGRASVLARGTYARVEPALAKLKPGDVIGYETKGEITHVSVVTGSNSTGVPVVAAHTADRFRNPWDLGWGKRTVFWLLQLRD